MKQCTLLVEEGWCSRCAVLGMVVGLGQGWPQQRLKAG